MAGVSLDWCQRGGSWRSPEEPPSPWKWAPESSDHLYGWWSMRTSSFLHWGACGSGGPHVHPAAGMGQGLGPSLTLGNTRLLWELHLHHIHEVAKAGGLVYGQVAITVQNAVVDDFAVEAHAQHVVPGMPHRLSHQEQPILRRLQQLHRLLARDLPVEPPAVAGGRVGLGWRGLRISHPWANPTHHSRHEAELGIR